LLEYLGLLLAAVHFAVPLAYCAYLKSAYRSLLDKPLARRAVQDFPFITIVVPTYNEAFVIEEKLEDIYAQDYPRSRLEVIVVDSASTDGTPEIAEKWAHRRPDLRVVVLRESERRGKAHALNEALKHSRGEVVVVTDADSKWVSRDTLKRLAEYFASDEIGAVSCVKRPSSPGFLGVEEGYRRFYNFVRLAESRLWSTPVFHGELAAFRKRLLEELGGFPTDVGADDSHTAAMIALMGYRAVVAEDLECTELVPRRGYHAWRIRRAQHLIQSFARILRKGSLRRAPGLFRRVLLVEAFLHLVNPWLLLAAVLLLVASAVVGSLLGALLLVLGAVLLAYKPFRTWIVAQLYLLVAAVRNAYSRELVWAKQEKQ
jgi:cellulose synthase/poly-beta-1,6-N-acetylglucosamine synthase-like glycosyltransferase